jgi:hypothetical protein
MHILKKGRWSSTSQEELALGNESAVLDLELPSLQNCEKKCSVFKSHCIGNQ